MQIIEKTVIGVVLLAVIAGGACPQKVLAQIHRATALKSRAVSAPEYTSISVIDHSVEDRYLAYLGRLVECDFHQATLADVADYIQQQTAVPLYFDERALEEAGIGQDATISFTASQIPARIALKIMLSQMDLTLLAKSNVIFITTVEKADGELESRVYPVADLVSVQQGGSEAPDFDSLIDLITTVVAPATWDEVGGPGAIHEFRPKSALVISQTAEVHEAVAGLIEVLRRLPSTYSAEARTGIRRLAPLRSAALRSAEPPGYVHTPVMNEERSVGARYLSGGLFNIEPAQSVFPPSSTSAQTSAVQGNAAQSKLAQSKVAFPSWRTPRNHRD